MTDNAMTLFCCSNCRLDRNRGWVHKLKLFIIPKCEKLKSNFQSCVVQCYHWLVIYFCAEISELMYCYSQQKDD